MKKLIKYTVLSGSALMVLVAAILFTCAVNRETADASLDEHPFVDFITSSVPVPSQVELCGEEISLERWDMRERYDREINSFVYFHSTTLLYFKRANRYFPIIEPILAKNGIPDDLKYLCVIESNLDQRALSPAKAAGLWQFMETTGKGYGLEISSQVDERYYIEKATEAACKYFKEAYGRYGNWVNVAASYNAGMGRISGNMKTQYVDSAFDMLLVSETSRYVFRIMAIKAIFSQPHKYGFHLRKENLYPLIPVKQHEIDTTIPDLALFAKEQGLDYLQLKEFNPWLRSNDLTVAKGKSYRIDLPDPKDLYYDPSKVKVHNKAWIK
ncbi:lytic transglycosylase domain-containing protein [Bacteroidales bacterium OttesenSCG-928-L03]|nr:lytic transglycosylase domain-containing protein [Bacteroidales bacterium OttesenSCG-928-L03]